MDEMEQNRQPADAPTGVPACADAPLSADDLWEEAAALPGETAAAPPEAPLDMPAQNFRARPPHGPDRRLPRLRTIAARIVA